MFVFFPAVCLAWSATNVPLVVPPALPPAAHWAFQPPAEVAPPAVRQRSWVSTPLDHFILAGLEARRLRPAPPATRETLLRRVFLGLIGIPPTPAELDEFLADRSPEAWARVVDRLLASPHYGERWARHWLDVVRFAESDGFEHDAVRPHAWRYRDYVVRAFNQDKPWNRFIQEQVAGDELWPEDPDAVIATAFNLLGPDMVDSADQIQRRWLTLSDMTDTTATAFLGLTLGCARCHEHKLEPFTQDDYYSFQAYFAGTEFHRDLPVPTPAERRQHELELAGYNALTKRLHQQLRELTDPCRARLQAEKLSAMSEDVQEAHRTPRERRTAEQESTVLETAPHLQVSDAEVVKALTPSEQTRHAALQAELKKIPKPKPLPQSLALQNTNGPLPLTRILLRGDYHNPDRVVAAAVPAVLRPAGAAGRRPLQAEPEAGDGGPGNGRGRERTSLARWLTSPANPLTARVVVNRVWQHHFGRGIVATPNDFGTQGARPSHPELLDWLAREFMAHGWSLKALHRLILLSSTYRQSTDPAPAALRADPENHGFSRQNRVRLEGEALRDSLLYISRRLNPQSGGPSVQPPIAPDIVKTAKNWTADPDPSNYNRRSLYIFARRNLRFPFLEVFDAPDSNLSCAERAQSTTAPQSLTLLNSAEVNQAALATALSLVAETAPGDPRIVAAFRRILARRPNEAELRASREFVKQTRARAAFAAAAVPGTAAAATSAAADPPLEWNELCRALFNLNDFVYVD